MPEVAIVSTARSPIGWRFQGLPQATSSPPHRHDHSGRPRQGPRAGPQGHRRPDARLRPPRRRAGQQPRPHRRRADGHGPPPGLHHHPLLFLVPPDEPHGPARHQGRRGRRLHLGLRRVVSASPRATPTPSPHAQPLLRGGRGPHRGRRPVRGLDLARPARGRPRPGRLHRHGPDRREPRPHQGRHPPGHGRVRRPLPEPRRGGHQERLLGA